METKLVVVGGDAEARQYDLQLPAIIGRSRSADVMLDHPLVSRQHCEVFETSGVLMVRDLASRNGTFVGETRVADQAVPVKPGDLLMVGGVTFRAEYSGPHDNSQPSTWDATGPTVEATLAGAVEIVRGASTRREPPGNKGSDGAPRSRG